MVLSKKQTGIILVSLVLAISFMTFVVSDNLLSTSHANEADASGGDLLTNNICFNDGVGIRGQTFIMGNIGDPVVFNITTLRFPFVNSSTMEGQGNIYVHIVPINSTGSPNGQDVANGTIALAEYYGLTWHNTSIITYNLTKPGVLYFWFLKDAGNACGGTSTITSKIDMTNMYSDGQSLRKNSTEWYVENVSYDLYYKVFGENITLPQSLYVISNSTIPSPVLPGSSGNLINVTINDTLGSSILGVYFNITYPNGTNQMNYQNGSLIGGSVSTSQGQEWHSQTFEVNPIKETLGVWNYNYTIISNSTSTNQNITQSGTFNISDATKPSLLIDSPSNNTIQPINFTTNFTIFDNLVDGIDSCWFNINSQSNHSLSCSNGTNSVFINISSGVKQNITIFSNDSSNNIDYKIISDIYGDNIVPGITINKPTGSLTSTTVSFNISIAENTSLSYCFYNVTRGASVEVSNTAVSCASEITGTFVVSGSATYSFNFGANDTSNNFNSTSGSFIVSLSVGGGGGGGGGGSTITNIINSISDNSTGTICEPFFPAFQQAYSDYTSDLSFENFKSVWYSFWDFVLCKSAASIVPL